MNKFEFLEKYSHKLTKNLESILKNEKIKFDMKFDKNIEFPTNVDKINYKFDFEKKNKQKESISQHFISHMNKLSENICDIYAQKYF